MGLGYVHATPFTCAAGWPLLCPQPGVTCGDAQASPNPVSPLWCGAPSFARPPKKDQMHRENFSPGGPVAQNLFCPEQPGCLPRWVTIHGTVGVWLAHGVVGFTCAAACQGNGGHCVPGVGRGVTLLAAWAALACTGTVRGEGRTEEFAIWASLLLSCCYGTAEMLPGRRRWPAFVTPGLPRGSEMSLVYKASLPYPTSPGENGVSYHKIPQQVGLQGLFVRRVTVFN